MDRTQKQLYSLTELQFTRLAEQRSHDKQTQQAFEKFMAIASQGGNPRIFLCGFSEFSILDENDPEDQEHLRDIERRAMRFKS
jgi:hypothetical protein